MNATTLLLTASGLLLALLLAARTRRGGKCLESFYDRAEMLCAPRRKK